MPKKEVIKKSAAKKAPVKKIATKKKVVSLLSKGDESKMLKSIKNFGKLPKDFKRNWIEALKSGKYKQGDGALRASVKDDETGKKSIKHCCLGVACAVAGATGILDKGFITNDGLEKKLIKSINKVPAILQSDKLEGNDIPNVLASLNDEGKSFKEIAKVIQKYL